jgi:hypothetical protein
VPVPNGNNSFKSRGIYYTHEPLLPFGFADCLDDDKTAPLLSGDGLKGGAEEEEEENAETSSAPESTVEEPLWTDSGVGQPSGEDSGLAATSVGCSWLLMSS